jgi:hypothetical protein
MRGCHSPGSGRITAPGSSWPQSTSHRAAEALPDFERGLDDGVARELRRDRFEFICTRAPLAIVHSSREERGGMFVIIAVHVRNGMPIQYTAPENHHL